MACVFDDSRTFSFSILTQAIRERERVSERSNFAYGTVIKSFGSSNTF